MMISIEITQETDGKWSLELTDNDETAWENIGPVTTDKAIEIVTKAMNDASS